MKKRVYILGLILTIITNSFNLINAQVVSMEQITIFGSRIRNPIVLDVRTEQNNIYFNVNNRSFYPYIFEVTFGDFRNLSPRAFDKKTILMPGINRLFTFKVVNPNEQPVLSYQTRFYLAKTNLGDHEFSPYLVPVGKNKTVEFLTTNENGFSKIFIDQFVLNIGDTVFNSRKGVVTALPKSTTEIDRIIDNSFEIRHEDGTIAVYMGLNPETKEIKLGQTVFPGQPLGIIGQSKILTFRVFEVEDEGSLKSLNILYQGPEDKMLTAQNLMGLKVLYPNDIIKKEMTKKEMSKYEKHSLY
jgi:hypothetical protein